MKISLEDVKSFAQEWFQCVASGGTGDEQAKFHLHRDARIFVGNGSSFTLDEHHELHKRWTDEKHGFGCGELTNINEKPERVRAEVTVYWEARNSENSLIKAVVAETWIVERTSQGLKFVLYASKAFTPLPGSSPVDF